MSLTITGASRHDEIVGVRMVGPTISEVGPQVVPQPGDEVIDAAGMAVVPGLVNGHTHAAMTLMRGYGDDLPLMTWLQNRIWPAEARLDPEDVYWGTRLAAIEMLRSGTLHFADMYWYGPAVAQAATDTGIRATVSAVFFDQGDPDAGHRQRPEALAVLDEISQAGHLVRPSVGPHSIYAVSKESLRWLADIAIERDIPLHIHLSETAEEVSDCEKAHGMRPAELLDSVGALNERSLLAHGNWLSDAELDLIAEREATVVTNPSSNMKLATGRTLAYSEATRRGVRVGLGTDGAASNNSLDLLGEVKLLALLHKQLSGDPSVLSAEEAMGIASGSRSPLLSGTDIVVGNPADLLLVRTDSPEMMPSPLTASLVYAASASAVDTAVVAGRVVMQGRHVPGTEEVLGEVQHRAAKLRVIADLRGWGSNPRHSLGVRAANTASRFRNSPWWELRVSARPFRSANPRNAPFAPRRLLRCVTRHNREYDLGLGWDRAGRHWYRTALSPLIGPPVATPCRDVEHRTTAPITPLHSEQKHRHCTTPKPYQTQGSR